MSLIPVGVSIGQAAVQGLINLALIRPRAIGPFVADVTIEEKHIDRLSITRHPVSTQAAITDHSYKEPAQCTIKCGFSNSGPQANGLGGALGSTLSGLTGGLLNTVNAVENIFTGGSSDYVKQVYAQFLALQASRAPFDIITGKRIYTNMLIESLQCTTDYMTENSLIMICDCQEVLLAQTQVVTVGPSANMANPQINGATQNAGQRSLATGSNYNANAVAQ